MAQPEVELYDAFCIKHEDYLMTYENYKMDFKVKKNHITLLTILPLFQIFKPALTPGNQISLCMCAVLLCFWMLEIRLFHCMVLSQITVQLKDVFLCIWLFDVIQKTEEPEYTICYFPL